MGEKISQNEIISVLAGKIGYLELKCQLFDEVINQSPELKKILDNLLQDKDKIEKMIQKFKEETKSELLRAKVKL